MIQPRTAWAVTDAYRNIMVSTLRATRTEAISAAMGTTGRRRWRWFYQKHGWRCIRVTVTACHAAAGVA